MAASVKGSVEESDPKANEYVDLQEAKKACKLIKDRFGVDEASTPGNSNLLKALLPYSIILLPPETDE